MSQLLCADRLCFSYNNIPLIQNLSFTLNEKEHLLVSGPNGSGKTTLLRIILGLLRPESGTLTKKNGLRISYCKQDFPNPDFPISAFEVVAMGLETKGRGYRPWAKIKNRLADDREKIHRAMIRTDCFHLRNKLFSSLSGGERQRVSLARCFCQNADLILLDEPSSFLDVQSQKTLISFLTDSTDTACIAVTHDTEVSNALNWPVIDMGER